MNGETIAAIATASGSAGVAIVRVSGPDAFEIAAKVAERPLKRGMQFVRCSLDECLVLGFKAPKSYTGEDVVEFQCHGGPVTSKRILEALFAAGARLARRGEFTQRAFLNGKLDYDQAESVLDLINAKTVRAAEAAREGLAGRKQRDLRALYEAALQLSSELEHALDVSEEELPDSFLPHIKSAFFGLRTSISAEIRRAREGRLLRNGACVVLAGEPNAGKSSLMNALLEENRAIVSDIPGTTRDSIEAWMDLGGFPIRLIDTAGLRDTSDSVEAEGVRRAQELVASADLVLGLDCDYGIRVHSKCDLARGEGLNVSAKTGEGLDELKSAIISALERKAALADSADSSADDHTLSVLLDLYSRLEYTDDIVLLANLVRIVADSLGSLVGAQYSSDLLDALFSRFCVGK